MATLEHRIGHLEQSQGSVGQRIVTVLFVSPSRGIVGMRHGPHLVSKRLDNETEMQLLTRANQEVERAKA